MKVCNYLEVNHTHGFSVIDSVPPCFRGDVGSKSSLHCIILETLKMVLVTAILPLIVSVGEMHLPIKGTIHYYAQLGLPDKGRAIKGLVFCFDVT